MGPHLGPVTKWITAPKARALVALTWTGGQGRERIMLQPQDSAPCTGGAWPVCILCLCSTHGPCHFPHINATPGIGVEGRTVRPKAHAPCQS